MTACPISVDKVDANVVRLNGFFTLIFILAGFYNGLFWFLIMLDFFPRAFNIRYSPVANLSKLFINNLKIIKPKAVDAAPKKFASFIGLSMSIVLTGFYLSNLKEITLYFAYFFMFPVFLETFFNYCLGCKIYSFLFKLNFIKHKINDSDFSSLR